MSNYRKIWESSFGKIPVDENGVSYEIHHKDGDRSNNSLDNLVCVSIEEHLRIHHSQSDWGACNAIVKRMRMTKEELSKLNSKYSKLAWTDIDYRKLQKERLDRQWKDPRYVEKFQGAGRKKTFQRVADGTHQFLSDVVRKNNNEARRKVFAELTRTGNHNFQSHEAKQLSSEMAKNRNSIKSVCPHCSKEGVGPVMKRHHFDNCKLLVVDSTNGH